MRARLVAARVTIASGPGTDADGDAGIAWHDVSRVG